MAPMGTGVDTDIATGRPVAESVAARRHEAVHKVNEARKESIDLLAELHGGNPVLEILVEEYVAILSGVASKNPRCQAIERILAKMRHKVEVAPVVAEHQARRLMGPQLEQFLITRAAPQGIPASEL